MDIFDDMGVSKLSPSFFLKVNYSFKTIYFVYENNLPVYSNTFWAHGTWRSKPII